MGSQRAGHDSSPERPRTTGLLDRVLWAGPVNHDLRGPPAESCLMVTTVSLEPLTFQIPLTQGSREMQSFPQNVYCESRGL